MCAVALTRHALRFESLLAQPTGEARRERCNDVSKYRAPAVRAPRNSSCTDLNLTKTCMARMSNFDWMHAMPSSQIARALSNICRILVLSQSRTTNINGLMLLYDLTQVEVAERSHLQREVGVAQRYESISTLDACTVHQRMKLVFCTS